MHPLDTLIERMLHRRRPLRRKLVFILAFAILEIYSPNRKRMKSPTTRKSKRALACLLALALFIFIVALLMPGIPPSEVETSTNYYCQSCGINQSVVENQKSDRSHTTTTRQLPYRNGTTPTIPDRAITLGARRIIRGWVLFVGESSVGGLGQPRWEAVASPSRFIYQRPLALNSIHALKMTRSRARSI